MEDLTYTSDQMSYEENQEPNSVLQYLLCITEYVLNHSSEWLLVIILVKSQHEQSLVKAVFS